MNSVTDIAIPDDVQKRLGCTGACRLQVRMDADVGDPERDTIQAVHWFLADEDRWGQRTVRVITITADKLDDMDYDVLDEILHFVHTEHAYYLISLELLK